MSHVYTKGVELLKNYSLTISEAELNLIKSLRVPKTQTATISLHFSGEKFG